MGFEVDPNFIGAELFNKCVKTGYYGREDMYKSNRPYEIPCDDFPEQYITVNIANSIESFVSVNGFDVEYFHYIGSGTTLDLGERLKRVDVLDSNGTIRDRIWSDADGNALTPPDPNTIIEEGRDHPIGSETILISETASTGLTAPSEYVTYAIVQIASNSVLVAESINGDPSASLTITYLAKYSLDGSEPSNDLGYVASHGTTIKLDSLTQINNFRVISQTDSSAFGADIRPKLTVTYYIGTSRFGRI